VTARTEAQGKSVRTLAMVLGAVLLVISIIAAQLWLELRAEREQGRQLMAGGNLQQPLPAAMPVGTPVGESVNPSPADPAQPAARETPAAGEANSLFEGLQEVVNTPEGREFMRTMMVATLQQEYPDLAKALNLSPAEADKLIELIARQRTDLGMEAGLQIAGSQDPAARQERARQLAQREQALEAEVAALLGERYPKWQEYERTAETRRRSNLASQQANQLRTAISSRNNPLSDAQFEPLAAALAAEQQRIDQESRGLSTQRQMQRVTEDHRRLADVAAVYLNPEQLERYKRHLQQQADMARAISGLAGGAMGAQGVAAPGASD
jgi:hypothetical protein